MSDELTIDSEIFISSKRASELSGYKQDYIGQLSRGGQILARMVGGLWYVSSDSLTSYMARAEAYKPVPPKNNAGSDPDALLSFDGRGYISAARAAKLTGYSADYVGQMARAGIIPSRQVGNRWYVERAGILSHKESKDALLGAVQAQSVGIKTPTTGDANEGIGYLTDEPFFQYTSDNRELMPAITPVSEEKAYQEEDAREEEHIIPIRVRSYQGTSFQTAPRRSALETALPEPRRSMLPMVLTAGLFTIVVVLSLGFMTLKDSSIYTSNKKEGGKASVSQLAGAAASLIGRIGDSLEVLIVPEVVYRRGE